jgi:hypothetical protein
MLISHLSKKQKRISCLLLLFLAALTLASAAQEETQSLAEKLGFSRDAKSHPRADLGLHLALTSERV